MGCGGSTAGGGDAIYDVSEQDISELGSDVPSDTQVLRCSTNKLTTLPASICSLSQLTELDASTNALTALPADIASLAALEKLLLFANKIKELPAKLPPNVSELNLFNNQLKKLPDSIGELTKLEEVNLAANKLMMTKDAMFTSWGTVTVLNMYDNNLVRFGSLAPLTSLTELRLSGNNLEEMPTLSSHPGLKIIEMHKNRVATIPDAYFEATPALERLSLWGNMLTALPSSIMGCKGLVGLQVQENKLEVLPAGAYPVTLETLFVQENPLKMLPGELAACAQLKRVNVSKTALDDDGKVTADAVKTTCMAKAGGIFWSYSGEQSKA